jgi:hypothetical protein
MHVCIIGKRQRTSKNPRCNHKKAIATIVTEPKPSSEYVMPADFCQIFQSAMPNLHLLALLLTGEQNKAEECFIGGLEDCVHGNPVFKQWSQSWAKRAIIKRAVRMISPRIGRDGSESSVCATDQAHEANVLFSAVIELPSFERFVFVVTVLERCSDQECSLLLNCTRRDVVDARARAIQLVAESAKDRLVDQIEHCPG